jgi:hypothetical protein
MSKRLRWPGKRGQPEPVEDAGTQPGLSDRLMQIASYDSPPRDEPIRRQLPTVQPNGLLFGRDDELVRAQTELVCSRPLIVSGPQAIGKSSLLEHFGHQRQSSGDEVAMVNVLRRTRDEVVQAIFDAFFVRSSGRQTKVGLPELTRHTADLNAIVVLDEQDLLEPELRNITQALPQLRLVFTSEHGLGVDVGRSFPLGGLSEDKGLELFQHEHEGMTNAEEPSIRELVVALGGHPGRIKLAAIALRNRVAEALADGARAYTVDLDQIFDDVWAGLDNEARRVLLFLDLLDGAAASPILVGRTLGLQDAPAVLTRLEELGLIRRNSPRYRLVAPPELVAQRRESREGIMEAALGTYAKWALEHRTQPEVVVPELDTALTVLRHSLTCGAFESHNAAQQLDLAWGIEPALARSGRWDAWSETLDTIEELAERDDDLPRLVGAHHRRGMWAVAVDDRQAARDAFLRALKLARDAGRPDLVNPSLWQLTRQELPALARENWLPAATTATIVGVVGAALRDPLLALGERFLRGPQRRRVLGATVVVGVALAFGRRETEVVESHTEATATREKAETSATA